MLGFNFDLNLKKQLIFYGSYHNNPVNQAIHFIFVPLILWTVAVWLAYTPPLFPELSLRIPSCCAEYDFVRLLRCIKTNLKPISNISFCRYVVFNASFFLLALYSAYYVTLEACAGLSWTILVALPLWITSEAFQQHCPTHAWISALGLHILSWIMQVYFGHAVAEKRKPALLDSFFQSLVLAPLFVWFELLFFMGYRKRLHADVSAQVLANISEWKKQTAPLLSPASNDDSHE